MKFYFAIPRPVICLDLLFRDRTKLLASFHCFLVFENHTRCRPVAELSMIFATETKRCEKC